MLRPGRVGLKGAGQSPWFPSKVDSGTGGRGVPFGRVKRDPSADPGDHRSIRFGLGILASLLSAPGRGLCKYKQVVEQMHRSNGSPSVLYYGEEGDLLRWPTEKFPRIDLIFAGLPCPPFSGLGLHLQEADSRYRAFEKSIGVFVYLIHEKGLKCIMIENVKGVLQQRDGAPAFYPRLIKI